MAIRIVTWNVNGIRNPFKYAPWNRQRTLQSMLDLLEGDIVCFQEVKTPKAGLTDDLVAVDGWDTFYSFPHSQTGYSGVAVYTRDAKCIPLRVEEGVTGVLRIPGTPTRYVDAAPDRQIGGYPTDRQLRRAAVGRDVIDSEGRCLLVEFPLFVLINVYCPARRNQQRTGYRNTFLLALDARIRNLAAIGKNIVLLGDLNITRDQLDAPGIWDNHGNKSVADALAFDATYMAMRAPRLLNQLLFNSRTVSDLGRPFVDDDDAKQQQQRQRQWQRRPPVLCDTGREFHPARTGMFTCWDTRKNHRPANYGSRIDYIACSPKIMQLVQDADIQPQLHGSDHCPVYIVLRDRRESLGHTAHTLDYLNPPGRFVNGQHVLPPDKDAALLRRFAQSARRLPQFSNRRHIGNMFRQATQQVVPQAAVPAAVPPAAAPTPTQRDGGAAADTPADLPAVFKADTVEFVESEDDGNMSRIEDDDSDVPNMVDDDDEQDPIPRMPTSKETNPFFSGKIASARSSPAVTQATERPAPATPSTALDELEPRRNPAAKPPDKEPASTSTASTRRTLVRARSGTSTSGSSSSSRPAKKPKTTGTQTSMSMFLRARDPLPPLPPLSVEPQQASTDAHPELRGSCSESALTSPGREEEDLTTMTAEEVDAAFKNLDAAKASWSKLGLGQRQAPLCEHGEPCKTLVTKKAGVNSGRSFFMCARPPGPLGKSEKGTAWQCPTFVWCRDWKPDR